MGALTSPEDVAQAMERIEKEAIRMGELVEDLLELARIDEAKPVQLTPVDLVPIAYDAALDAMASAPDRTVNVVINEPEQGSDTLDIIDPAEQAPALVGRTAAGTVTGPIAFAGAQLARLRARRPRPTTKIEENEAPPAETPFLETPAVILGEENKIRQVFTNLLGNAMRFTNANSPIEIGVSVDPARRVALLDIIDHGEGIPPQIREKIFQRFWRADTSRTRETGGSGLGLAIVAGIVRAHNGSVEVLETEGGGATFRVVLPLLPRDWAPAQSATRA
jgi:two-component system OmpR family sensor kinase